MPPRFHPDQPPLREAPAPPPFGGGNGRRFKEGGFTVMEAGVAGMVITIFLASLFALNSNMVRLLRSASETANASEELQLRVEQIRLATWKQITDPTWFSAKFFTPTDALTNLSGMVESVTVTPYLSPSSAPSGNAMPSSFTVRREGGASTVRPAGYAESNALAQQEMIRIDVSITWPGLSRTRTRTLTTLVSRWGISK